VPILAGAGAALIRRGDTVLSALAVSGGMMRSWQKSPGNQARSQAETRFS
jgi:hypothetical protein